jgi:hypothetical protein
MTSTPVPSAPVGLRSGMSFSDWAATGARIARIHSGACWALGDWLLFGERHFPGRYRSAMHVTDLEYQTLRNYAWVARRVEATRRRGSLSFQHHAEVAGLSAVEQDLWLNRAEMHGWSRNELRRRLRCEPEPVLPIAAGSPTVLRVEASNDELQRWRSAAARADQDLADWIRSVADTAAGTLPPRAPAQP